MLITQPADNPTEIIKLVKLGKYRIRIEAQLHLLTRPKIRYVDAGLYRPPRESVSTQELTVPPINIANSSGSARRGSRADPNSPS